MSKKENVKNEGYENRKRRFGDRKDGYRVRDLDSMHVLTPYLMPDRTNNEAFLSEVFDLTKVNEYIAKKNADDPEFKYTFFHFFMAALAKVMTFRPKMNYFISGHRIYERRDLTFAFVVRRKFTLSGGESLAVIKLDRDSDEAPIFQIYNKVKKFVYHVRREEKKDGITGDMDFVAKLPRFLIRFLVWILKTLEYHGHYPEFLRHDDPEYCSVFISNLGSIKMSANYHHLVNWGTNSFFVVINEKKLRPFFNPDGSYEMRDSLDISFTVDERLADGFYFANSIKMIKKIFDNPELVELPLATPIPEFEEGVSVKNEK
ncbi:MAG: hypothetical protein E7675_06850 [Ruminococcaceae bacterium]|nr:hypothetical protein [Oscillospiraceae bacterium]